MSITTLFGERSLTLVAAAATARANGPSWLIRGVRRNRTGWSIASERREVR